MNALLQTEKKKELGNETGFYDQAYDVHVSVCYCCSFIKRTRTQRWMSLMKEKNERNAL